MKALPNDPPWLKQAIGELGVLEAPGKANNPRVVNYYKEAGHPEVTQDSVAWCAAFTGAMLVRGGYKGTGSLMARSYRKWGREVAPVRGCIAVLERGRDPTYGHVGIYLRTVGDYIELLSGNAANSVCVKLFPKRSVLNYRWPNEPVDNPVPEQVPHETVEVPAVEAQQSQDRTPDAVRPDAAPLFQQPAPTYEGAKADLRKAGSRTIHGVDRIVGYVRKALAALGVYTFTDVTARVADVQSAKPLLDNLWPVLVVGLVIALVAILYANMEVEEARVDDHVNGQQGRTPT